jgi:hypothetical protein
MDEKFDVSWLVNLVVRYFFLINDLYIFSLIFTCDNFLLSKQLSWYEHNNAVFKYDAIMTSSHKILNKHTFVDVLLEMDFSGFTFDVR